MSLVRYDTAPIITDPNIEKVLLTLIAHTYKQAGKVLDKKTLTDQAELLRKEIEKYFSSIITSELENAFDLGLRGEYGEVYGLHMITYHHWIKSFKRASNAAKSKLQWDGAKIPTPDQLQVIEDNWKKVIVRQFDAFKRTGALECAFPNHLYGELERRGFLYLSPYDKWRVWELAIAKVAQRKKDGRTKARGTHERRRLGSFGERLEQGEITVEEEKALGQEAHLIAIKEYYRAIDMLRL